MASGKFSRTSRAVGRAVLGRVDLKVKGAGIPAPAEILQGLAVDGKLASVLSAAPLRRDQPGGADSATDYTKSGGRWVLINVVGVIGRVGIYINRATVLAPNRHDRLPPHGGGQIHLIGEGFFARAGITHIDHHIEVDISLPSIGLKIEEVGPEVEFSVATGGRVASITAREGHQIP